MSGLEEGTEYSARVRARYHDGDGNVEQSGPWSTTLEIAISSTPAENTEGDSNEGRSTSPPAKPSGLSTSPSHDSVDLSWTDPNDDSITGYQVLRGSDADNLAVLVDNTGKSSLSYTDSTVTAETTYAYAIRARNPDGLSPQTDAVSTTTQAAPPAKPEDLLAAATHNNVLLYWTDPDDDSITGYQILRGPDAANLAVLTNDTGNASASYTDDSVTAETTYIYAIRARNAQGLGPQSDAATANTPAAPVEPESDLAVGGAEFTLDAQPLDTGGTCSQSAIGTISNACTISISDSVVPLAIDGTLNAGAEVSFQVGPHLAGIITSTTIAADESDFTSDGDSVDVTFQTGRNLLRLVANPGGNHYFRVNVVSDDATLSALALTDASNNAITLDPTFASDVEEYTATVANAVTQIKVEPTKSDDSATIEYLDSADMALTDADTNTSVFDVDLAEGENVFKVKVTAEDTTTIKTYQVTVTRVDFLVSNLGQQEGPERSTALDSSQLAIQFTTGSHTLGYAISEVSLSIGAASGVAFTASIYSDRSDEPGSSLKLLTNPATIPTAREVVDFTADKFRLTPDTKYWVVIEKTSGTGNVTVGSSDSTSVDDGSAPGWNVETEMLYRDNFASPESCAVSGCLLGKIAVKGELATESDDATLSALALQDASNNAVALDPTFASDVEEYTATVANAVTQIKVEPTKSDDSATIEYLDSADMALMDADTNTTVFDVDLAEGENVLKVKVTAEDTTTTKTYTVRIRRAAADDLVSNLGQKRHTLFEVDSGAPGAATQFTTGNHANGYTIRAVRLNIEVDSGTTPQVSIYSDASGQPDESLKVLTNPGTIPAVETELDFGAGNYELDANTTYWIVIERASGTGSIISLATDSTSEDAGSATGWSIGDNGSTLASSVWVSLSGTTAIPQIAVKGRTTPLRVP